MPKFFVIMFCNNWRRPEIIVRHYKINNKNIIIPIIIIMIIVYNFNYMFGYIIIFLLFTHADGGGVVFKQCMACQGGEQVLAARKEAEAGKERKGSGAERERKRTRMKERVYRNEFAHPCA